MEHVLVMDMAVTPQEDGGTMAASTSTSTITMVGDLDSFLLIEVATGSLLTSLK